MSGTDTGSNARLYISTMALIFLMLAAGITIGIMKGLEQRRNADDCERRGGTYLELDTYEGVCADPDTLLPQGER